MDVEILKQKILNLAFRGKLVPQDPNDEPASVLIEKIKKEKNRLIKEGQIKANKEESYIYRGSDNCYYEKIPNNWIQIQLGEIINLKSGMDLSLAKINSEKIGIPYLTGASCFENEQISFTRWTDVPTNISNIGDILISVKGTVGKMAFNTYGDIHIARQIMSIKVNDLINSEYIYYAISSKIPEITSKSAGLIPGITRETILSLVINIPPKKEQDRIVSSLKTLIPKILKIQNEYKDISKLSSIIKMKILDYYFGENSSYKSYYPSIIMKNVCALDNGVEETIGEFPYLEAKVIRGVKEPKYINKGVFISKGTKIILVDGENSGEIMCTPYDGYMGSTFRILTINTSIVNDDYLSLFLLYKKQELKDSKTGSAIPHLNKKIFNNYELPLLPIEKQIEISTKIHYFFELLNLIISS